VGLEDYQDLIDDLGEALGLLAQERFELKKTA
jgi:hypothetical protein